MMRRIFKYPIPRKLAKFSVTLPQGFKFLRVSYQEEQLMMWCEIKDATPLVATDFQAFGTGHDIPHQAKYLTTYDDGPFVLHLYQVGGG